MVGAAAGLGWTALQFFWLIPVTGGGHRSDIVGAVEMMDGTTIELMSFVALGVIGGGITEEFYNHGFFIRVLQALLKTRG